jgi:hypothetical protein
MTTLKLGTRLNAQSWERALERLPQRYSEADYDDRGLLGERLVIDLRQVGFADFVTLGHMLLLVRLASDAGADCSVLLPDVAGVYGEAPPDSEAAMRSIRRYNCHRYLEQAGVVEALGRIVSNTPDADDGESADPVEGDWPPALLRPDPPHRARRILRYRWIPVEAAQDDSLSSTTAELERNWRELGLSAEMAAAVTRGVMHELLENAALYARARAILLGGVIVDPETYGVRHQDFDPDLGPLAEQAYGEENDLVRFVVADAGRGITRGTDTVLRSFDQRTGDAGDSARGLWKASRVVRAHEGSLLISSGGHVMGRVCDSGGVRDTERSVRAALPGTLVECALLTAPHGSAVDSAGELVTPPRRDSRTGRGASAGHRPPRCLAAGLRSPDGLCDADLDRIRDELARTASKAADLVVTINAPEADATHDVEIGRAISRVAEIAAGSGDRTVSLAFPSANRALMAVSIEHLNAGYDERAAAGRPTPAPILVLAPNNRHYWVGGTVAQRRVLARLSCSEEPVPLAAAASWPAEEMAALAELRESTALLRTVAPAGDDAVVTLRTLPQDAVTALARWVRNEIARAIVGARTDPEQPDVWKGTFRTPSLRVTSRWFDLDALLSRLDIQAVAGLALAALVEDALRTREIREEPVVLPLRYTPEGVLRTFTAALTGRHRGVAQRPGPRDGARREPEPVLLVADTISSGATVGRVLLDVSASEPGPVVVAVVVDTRPKAERVMSPDHIVLPSGPVPLVKLATVTVDAEDSDDATLVDPVLRRPEVPGRPVPRYLNEQKKYVDAMKRNSAARLGHIERPADRHYTAYVDPTLLFREEEWSRTVLADLTADIGDRHRRAGPAGTTMGILYPAATADDLRTAATLLQKALGNVGLKLADGPVAVPRAAHARNWQLPGSVVFPAVRHAVILDSGASTGHTVQQLVGLAADMGVSTITVVLLLNGMSDSDAVNLQRITTVRRSAGKPADQPGPDGADLKIIYVARTAMSRVLSGHCAVCALRDEYAAVTLHMPLQDSLAKHRLWLVSMLEPRTKQELFEEQAVDLFGATVSQAECVEYLSWRLRLREAELNTRRRRDVATRLESATADRAVRDSLLRLLVAESQWLKSEPLSFPRYRAIIADLAVTMLTGDQALLIEQRLRIQAVILLVHADPDRFAQELAAILRTNRRQGLVVSHVLLETLLLISRVGAPGPHERPAVVSRLVHSLDSLQDHLRRSGGDDPSEQRFLRLPLVRYVTSYAMRSQHQPPTDIQSAWAALAARFQDAGHDYANRAWMVRSDIEFAEAGEDVTDPEGIRDGWSSCANYLLDRILPNLRPLRQILLSRAVRGDIPGELGVRWEQTVQAEGGKLVDDTTVRIDDYVDWLRRGGRTDAALARSLFADLEWWTRFALDDDGILPNLIRRAPVDALDVVRRRFIGPRIELDENRLPETSREGFLAFCTDRLLNDIVSHILMNAQRTHRIEGIPQRILVELDLSATGQLVITVFNDASTRESVGNRSGLDAVGHRLERFGGAIDEVEPGEGWTFAVAIRLEKWRVES